jgi:putative pyruvate formate lyase activating enzyme
MSATPKIALSSLHMWEEPIISGTRGSGTIFFSGCSLRCVFCQNYEILTRSVGREYTESGIAEIMLSLERDGAHNVNFVTPTHFAPSVKESVRIARERGFSLPIVYNTSSFDSVDTLRELEGTVDVYLADYKYFMPKTACALASADNYPNAARLAISEMVRQQPRAVIEDGLMKSGVIVRILLLPGHVAEAKLILREVYREYGDRVYVSLMSQYTPSSDMSPPLDRRVTRGEYNELVSYAEKLGVENAFVQEFSSADEAYVPKFDI